jgi:hypothetical protein
MKDFDLGPVVLLIIFVLIPLANYVLSRLGRRFEHSTPPRQPMPDMGLRRQAAPLAASNDTRQDVRGTPPTEAITPKRKSGSRRTPLGTRRDIKRAIVSMTILGPCRAYDPPD